MVDCKRECGFATLEMLAAVTLAAITLLAVAATYLTAHTTLERSGNTSVTVGLARRILEDLRSIPYASLVALDGFATDDPSTLPDDDPERDIARRWLYAVDGDGPGWPYTVAEMQDWPTFAMQGAEIRGRIEVTSPSGSMRQVIVTMTVPGRPKDIRLATLISRSVP